MQMRSFLLCGLLAAASVEAARFGTALGAEASMQKNPIRKVVVLLQDMQKEIEVEGAKEKELHEKFMCFCQSSGTTLAEEEARATAAIEELTAKGKAEKAESTQTTLELADHKTDRESAKKDLAEATSLREKEAAEFASSSAERKTNIEGLGSAVATLEAATGGAFIQLPNARLIKRITEQSQQVDDWDRQTVVAFLEQKGEESAPASGQIIGVMKQMKDEMEESAKNADADEASAASGFAELEGTKKKEIEIATEAIETKTVRTGELAVSIVQTADELDDTTAELAQTQNEAATMTKQCATRQAEWGATEKARADEIAAVGEAISILNGDEALGLFQKVIPAQEAAPSFMQLRKSSSRPARAQAALAKAAAHSTSTQLKLTLFTVTSKLKQQGKGQLQNFDDIVKMIDAMVGVMGKEQANDEKQKTFCAAEFDKSADEQSAAETQVQALTSSIEEASDTMATLADEIAALSDEIKSLDRSVALGTEQRKEEHAAYVEATTMNEAAIGLLQKAKARLEKVYKPALVQVDEDDDDQPAPEKMFSAVQKSQKGGGVLALMDTVVHDLEMGGKDADNEEKTSQSDYADLMSDSQKSRAQAMQSITDREATKANLEVRQQGNQGKLQAGNEDVMDIKEAVQNLHGSCDFIIENFALRKEARSNEIEGLKTAKAVLSGADFR